MIVIFIGKVAYELKLPTGPQIHPVFHISLHKKKLGEHNDITVDLPLTGDEGEIILEPKSILDTRWVKRGLSEAKEGTQECFKNQSHQPYKTENTHFLSVR